MKFNFKLRPLNSAFDDSAFFMRNVYKKSAMLFDCGRLGNLDNSELLDISDVFISHTHLDHFSGFDRFLRGCLNSNNTIRFYGPKGFINNMQGRLQGYNWNLITDYNIKFIAIELDEKGNKSALFSAKNSFMKEEIEAPQGDIDIGDKFILKYEFFDHSITSIGYRVCEPINISVNKEKLVNYGYKSGEWIKQLKNYLEANVSKNNIITVLTNNGSVDKTIGELEDSIIEYKKAQDVTYITDIAPSYENYQKAIAFAKDSALLLIEAVFMKNDVMHAQLKNHLTIDLSKDIFLRSNSLKVRFHHFAPKYDRLRDVFFKKLNKDIKDKIYSIN